MAGATYQKGARLTALSDSQEERVVVRRTDRPVGGWERFFPGMTQRAPLPTLRDHTGSGTVGARCSSNWLAQEGSMFAKKATWAVKSGLYRKWLAQKLINDIPKFAKNTWEDFDPDDVLHR